MVCTGSLNLPRTLEQSGWIGLLLIAICGIISTFTGVLIIKSLNMMDTSRVRNFNQIGQAAFGIPGRVIIYILYFINVTGIVGDYIILAGQSFHQIANGAGGLTENSWKLLCTAIMWLGCISLKQMSEAAVLSLVGIVTSMGAILIGVIQAFMYPYRDDGLVPVSHHRATHETARGSGVALALATISFAFCAVSVMPSVESSMRRPDKWNSVLGLSMAIVGITYIFVATVGYWAFGDQALAPFLDNLPPNAATKAAKILISLHVIFASPVMATSFALEIEVALNITKERLSRVREFAARLLLRTLFFVAMAGVALGIPFFGDVMALVGAFSMSLLLCVVPVACYVKLRGWRNISRQLLLACALVMCLGVYICIMGSKGAIEDMRKDLAANKAV
ncbi:hypothetical protein GGI17_004372 [Coemansia sp. S146]|nr:hypothetical protein GGI17_004372 [Coemansia sp. S146]